MSKLYGNIFPLSSFIREGKENQAGKMPQQDHDHDHVINLEIIFLRKELQISMEKLNFLEKDNQELRQELTRLKTHINSLKAFNNERKSLLWKKFQNSMDVVTFTDSSPQKPSILLKQQPASEQSPVTRSTIATPAPPPPPLPSKLVGGSKGIRRVPEVLELYRSLTKRDAQKESKGSSNSNGNGEFPMMAFSKNMIGEIENRSAYLSAIKSEVETHGNFVNFLIKEVESVAPKEISEVETFVKWLDRELSSLVDERAVLKHFPNWPERKADALREAAFTYRDLKSLESEVCCFRDNPKEEVNLVLKRAQALQDRLEQSINNVERTRDFTCKKYKDFLIPWEWMMDSGLIGRMKLSSLRLTKEYMRRITKELQSNESSHAENLLLQGVRFAYRVHQYAGGFDSEAIVAFEGLRKVGLGGQSLSENRFLGRG